MTTKREFCAYLRVSDEAGREGASFHSPADQRTRITAAVTALHGGVVVKEFEDMSFTGRVMDRPGLVAAVAWVLEDPANRGIATMNVSRLARNTKGIIELVLETLIPKGAVFVSAEQMIDASTAYGRKQLRDLASEAEAQSDMIGDTWKRVLAARAKRGDHPVGKKIYGYVKEQHPTDPKAKILVPDPVTSEVVRRMFRLYNGGTGLREIATILNEEGVPSPGGSTWGISTVSRTLENMAYVGKIEFQKERANATGSATEAEIYDASWEPLITQAVWDTFQSERRRRKKLPRKVQAAKWTLGGGLAVCGKCGSRLTVNSLASPKGMVMCSNYRAGRVCSGVLEDGTVVEGGVFMLRHKLDTTFTYMLGVWLDEVGKVTAASHDAHVAEVRSEVEASIRLAEDRLEVVEAARKRLRRQNAEGIITDEELRSDLADYHAEAVELRAKIADARDRLSAASPVGDVYAQLEAGGDGMTPSEWSRTLAKVIRRVELHDDKIVFVPVTGEEDKNNWRTVERDYSGKKRGRKPRRAPRVEAAEPAPALSGV